MTADPMTTPLDARSASGDGTAWVWAGRAIGGLVVMFLLLDGAIALVPIRPVLDAATQLQWSTDPGVWRLLGLILIAATTLYAVPRTALIGAILLTAYLGGAVATHARLGSPVFTHTLFGVYLDVLLWLSFWLREPRLRALLRGAR